jgi:hypothetical protein
VRLLFFAPVVRVAGLPLFELALLAGAPATIVEEIGAAAREADPAARRAALVRAEKRMRAATGIVPLAWLALDPRAEPRVHDVAVSGGVALLENAWVEP